MQFRGPQRTVDFSRDGDGGVVRDPLSGQTRSSIDTDIESQTLADSIVAPNCVVRFDNIESCTMAIWLDGFMSSRNGATIPAPLRIEWGLYLGVGCAMADADPFQGVTILKAAEIKPDGVRREGLLFQVNSRVMRTAWLCARLVEVVPNLTMRVPLRAIFWPVTGRPEVIVGTAIG